MARKPVDILLVDACDRLGPATIEALRAQVGSARLIRVQTAAEGLDVLLRGRMPNRRGHLVLYEAAEPFDELLRFLDALRDADNTRAVPVVVLAHTADEFNIRELYRRHANCVIPVGVDGVHDLIGHLHSFWLQTVELP